MTPSRHQYCTIPLTQGQVATVSEHRYSELARFKWYAYWNRHTQSFYALRNIHLGEYRHTTVSMARQILGLTKGDGLKADHEDHDTLNNQDYNLRVATAHQNQHNRGPLKGRTYKGVYLRQDGQKYFAKITVNRMQIHLGSFGTEVEAYTAYCKAATLYHGDFARLT